MSNLEGFDGSRCQERLTENDWLFSIMFTDKDIKES